MARCMDCGNGVIECGPNPAELCQGGAGFEAAGVFCFKLFVRRGPSGKCQVRVVPCIPDDKCKCKEVKCAQRRPPVHVRGHTSQTTRRKSRKKAGR